MEIYEIDSTWQILAAEPLGCFVYTYPDPWRHFLLSVLKAGDDYSIFILVSILSLYKSALKVKFTKWYDSQPVTSVRRNSRKYEQKYVWDQEWLSAADFRQRPKSSRKAHGCGIYERVRPVYCILQRFSVDLEETRCFPALELMYSHREQRCVVYPDTTRRAHWIVDRIIVLQCGNSRGETRMDESFERLWARKRKNCRENEEKGEKHPYVACNSGELLWGGWSSWTEKIQLDSSIK